MPVPTRALFLGLFSVLYFWAGAASAQPTAPVLRISTENAEDHVQTRAVARFAAQLKQRVGSAITVEFYSEAKLFRDRDVIRALEQGRVEMALPGIWQFDRFVPDVGLFFLPLLYGQSDPGIDRLRDGAVGREINKRIEGALDVRVLGRWIDLGAAQIFTIKQPIRQTSDIEGLALRTPGGEATSLRLAAQGAKPVTVAWPDLPHTLASGTMDGLVTTFETVASAKLWEHGLRYAYEDRAYFAQYIPLVSAAFWRRLPPNLKVAIQEAWEAGVQPSRLAAEQAQAQARSQLAVNGVRILTPTEEERAAAKKALLAHQPRMIQTLGIDPTLAELAVQSLKGSP
jgi:C4-dicarboxylate-binding protein DctP